ncbi:uncharacterized protein LOC113640028 isoform X2 [Tachysurus fulvidraco]|nr:uncharacterized protein LOC113640028 isoform X2 [Tachysurus fulvidraco]XP_047674476.1 uncharacterized protein LOC113640028 isoform X2 [Tachysurus fulvidraco]XP_047674477.1 uncharacterized protein LOC113640028 isoform X2 [Tachysurus fulvidraco]
MHFGSLRHCVLFFLILTVITAPTLAFTSVMVKLNQSAVLPCKQNCSDSLWTVIDKPRLIVAECNQTSCWSKEGFNMSHDQYLKGDLSLTINSADYSNRGLYTCECAHAEVNTVQLSIETLMRLSNLKSGEDLILHKSDYTELIYKSKYSHDLYGEQICNVTEDSLQCNDEYKHRALLKDSDLILKNLKPSDSGVYTIRDTLYKYIILICTLSVKDPAISRIIVNRHGSVTLNCTRNCTGLVEWINKNNKHVVAWCNQTSCNTEKGYNISHDQYLKGDLSLTITEAYYSMRGEYWCMCNKKCISEFDVSIQTENSSVHLKPGENLLMDLPRRESVEVIYRSTRSFADDADDKNICIFEHGSLECTDAYTRRISPVLKLEHVNLTDSGVYTIQSRNSQEAFFNYNMFVEEDQPRPEEKICISYLVFVLVVVLVVLLLVVTGVCIYLKCKRKERVVNEVQYRPV